MNTAWVPAFQIFSPKKLIGFQLNMSLVQNRTGELWQQFMRNRHLIQNPLSTERISMQIHPAGYFSDFNPTKSFTKWAVAEVSDFTHVPEGMETIEIPGGLYACFHYKGSSADTRIFNFIFQEWLPGSGYELDDRPHFEILGERYKNLDPESEEEICIPVKPVQPNNRLTDSSGN